MSNRNMKRRNKNVRAGRKGTQPIRVINSRHDPSYPPQNKTKPMCGRTLRYYSNAAVTDVDITGRCLLNTVLGTNTATTLAVNIYEAVRINRVSMYYVPSSTGSFGSGTEELILNWRGERTPDTRYSDRGTLSHPACIKARPPKESLAQFWITNQSNIDTVLFNVTMPVNSIIDISLSFVIGDGTTRSVTLNGVATFTGVMYASLNNAIAAGTVGADTLRPDSLSWADMTTP